MKSEDQVQQEIRLEAAKYGIVLWRNNSGALKDITGRVVRYGLANESKIGNLKFKSSDLIGIEPNTGKIVAVECKEENWNENKNFDARETAQKNFIEFVKARGGLAGFASSVISFKKIIGK